VLLLVIALGLAACTSAAPSGRGATAGDAAPVTSSPLATSSTAGPSTATAGTRQVVFEPFSGNALAAGLLATGSDTGSCSRYGGGSGSRDYYRCFGTDDVSGHTFVYDPCFADPAAPAAALACPTDVLRDEVVRFTATSVDTSAPPFAVNHPWAMQLAGGQLCLFGSGAWGGLGPYACHTSPGQEPVADCHAPVAGRPSWSAECQPAETARSPFRGQQVNEVWF
jgi:hypothetical protein